MRQIFYKARQTDNIDKLKSLILKVKRMSYRKKPREAFYRNELQVVDADSVEPSRIKTQSEANKINVIDDDDDGGFNILRKRVLERR